jgi:hypothetical protein
MAKQVIGVGAAPNDGTGDTLRAGGIKINANYDDLYLHREYHVDDYVDLQAAIDACNAAGGGTVHLPHGHVETLTVPLIAKDNVIVRGANRKASQIRTHTTTGFVGDSMIQAYQRGDGLVGNTVRNFHLLDCYLLISNQNDVPTLSTTLNGATETAIVVSAIPANAAASGVLYIELDSGVIRRQVYTSWSGNTFTIPSSDYTDPADATAGVDVMIPLACIDVCGMVECSFERLKVEGRGKTDTEHVAIRCSDVEPDGGSSKLCFFNRFIDIDGAEAGGFRSFIQVEQQNGNANHNYFFGITGSCQHMWHNVTSSVISYSCIGGYFAGADSTDTVFRYDAKVGQHIFINWTVEPGHYTDGSEWGEYLIQGTFALRNIKGKMTIAADDGVLGVGMGNLPGAYKDRGVHQLHLCNRSSRLMRLQRGSGGQEYHDLHIENATDPDLYFQSDGAGTPVSLRLRYDGGIETPSMKSGTTQGGAGAVAGELWHDTTDDTIKMGV